MTTNNKNSYANDNHGDTRHKRIGEILKGINPHYFEEFDTERGHHHPGLACISCADARLSPDDLLSLPPGEEFIRKPLGGFLPQGIDDKKGLSGWFSLAVGIKDVRKSSWCSIPTARRAMSR